ncbi:DsbA family protein [Gibbsiella dentisursi]|uniref:DsbA family protein n=2 Tax=Gibbsiella dentisursi TaxID=796890 RepID=A0ABP7LEH4_9GAMM
MKLNNLALSVVLVTGSSITATATAMADKQSAAIVPSGAVAAEVHPVELPFPEKGFTSKQEARIGEVAKEYLLAHPEILVEVSQKLQVQQQKQLLMAITQAVLRHQDALLDDKSTPSYGPANAKVAFIEFFDYQCSVCAHQAPVIEALIKANPQVRYVFKEWPIFAQRWPTSLTAANIGLRLWQQKGADAYLAYHNALYATGHDEGKLTNEDIEKVAAKAGKLRGKNYEMLEVLSHTDTLAQNLGLSGTPGMIVMPMNGATVDNVTIILGGADQATLQTAIYKAAGQSGGE